jgi:hypothetical protein
MLKQITDKVMMIRPKHFRMNEQTAVNNYYQTAASSLDSAEKPWIAEFDAFVAALRSKGIEVIVFEDLDDLDTPDSVFPNNWISFHNNFIVTYPMFAGNRRLERRGDIVSSLKQRFRVDEHLRFEQWESQSLFLEGTGSIVLDRVNKLAYAVRSERTSEQVLKAWCEATGYESIVFSAFQRTPNGRKPVYHTNVVMSIGTEWAVVCSHAIDDLEQRAHVLESLGKTRTVIDIDEDTMDRFGGNILELESAENKKWLIMSTTASEALKPYFSRLSEFAEPLVVNIEAIENAGGGSARCMLAEVFLFSHEF